jgi:hypothetical protein
MPASRSILLQSPCSSLKLPIASLYRTSLGYELTKVYSRSGRRNGGFDGFGSTQGVGRSGWYGHNILNRVGEMSAIDCASFDNYATSSIVEVSRRRWQYTRDQPHALRVERGSGALITTTATGRLETSHATTIAVKRSARTNISCLAMLEA